MTPVLGHQVDVDWGQALLLLAAATVPFPAGMVYYRLLGVEPVGSDLSMFAFIYMNGLMGLLFAGFWLVVGASVVLSVFFSRGDPDD